MSNILGSLEYSRKSLELLNLSIITSQTTRTIHNLTQYNALTKRSFSPEIVSKQVAKKSLNLKEGAKIFK